MAMKASPFQQQPLDVQSSVDGLDDPEINGEEYKENLDLLMEVMKNKKSTPRNHNPMVNTSVIVGTSHSFSDMFGENDELQQQIKMLKDLLDAEVKQKHEQKEKYENRLNDYSSLERENRELLQKNKMLNDQLTQSKDQINLLEDQVDNMKDEL